MVMDDPEEVELIMSELVELRDLVVTTIYKARGTHESSADEAGVGEENT